MKNLFGTDGIRGIYGSEINPIIMFNLGSAIAKIAKLKNPNAVTIIASDTRKSRFTLINALKSGLTAYGVKVVDAHIMPTPVLSFITRKMQFDYGLMITASHNSEEYNGIKIFNSNGAKINDYEEMLISKNYYTTINNHHFNQTSVVENKNELKIEYINSIFKIFDFNMKNKNIIIDCANGATIKYVEKIFSRFGTNTKIIGNDENKNINDNCGVMHINNLLDEIKTGNFELGFAFDGDGDRIICVTKNLQILDGDKILYILTKFYKIILECDIKTVVGTIMSSYSLELALNQIGVNLIRTDVGDKNISRELNNKKLLLGAEKSGHIIIRDLNITGDGLFIALKLCELYFRYKINFDEEVKNIPKFPIIEYNLKIDNKIKEVIKNDKNFEVFYKEKKDFMKLNNGRLVIRPSGTEPVLRIMIECEDKIIAYNMLKEIENFINLYN